MTAKRTQNGVLRNFVDPGSNRSETFIGKSETVKSNRSEDLATPLS